ncbi:MAG: hypothetical protein OEQ29_17110 [Alphaproteobacteria bacterium]|nr:hypothetical protein [Alphaproteobacteria bacterium]
MRVIRISVLAAVVAAFTAPALACGGHASHKTAQTTVTKTGPQTTVKQTASTVKK